ncbi:MAG: HAMP domain-containing protein, partial [Gammaproteobacteria bacterium]
GLVLFAIVTVSAAFVMLQWQAMMDAEQTKHETLAGLTAENLAPALAFGDEQAVADTLRALLHEPDILKVTVSDPEHRAIQQVHRDMQDATSEGRKSLETFSVPVLLGEESLGELSVSVDMTPLRHELMQQLVWVGLMALAVLLLALLLALAMQRYLSGSVLALREGMRRVRDEADLSTRIEERGQDELAELARGFNAMIRQIRRHEAELEDKVRERTERLQLELDARERLERNLERMFWALDQMGEAMLLLNRDGRVDYVNPSFARLTGRNLAELSLVEQPLVSAGVMSEAQAAEAFEWLQQHEIWSSDLRSHRADGSEYPSHLSLARLADENGEITHYVAVLRDVSEQERLAEELRQAQKMEAVGVLVGGIAHDFNNMLAALSGSIELARLDAQDPARVREWLGDMEVLAHRGAETVAKLLAFARKGPIQFRTGDLRALFEELQKMVRIGVPESIDVRFDLADGPMPVNMDANQIEQAMLNLINNA